MTGRTSIREVLRFLGMEDEGLLELLRGEGLFVDEELEPFEADELRVAALLMREMGVNAAGVEVALHLRRRLLCLEGRVRRVLEELVVDEE
jgi:DNA-binding FadR family transcriptional regulator